MFKLNGTQIELTIFPDGTSQVWKLDEKLFTKSSFIIWEFSHEAELIHLAQLKALLDVYGVEHTTLYIDYLPYARQDKEVSNTSTFALLPFCKMLNILEFTEIIILDPHSTKALDLINNSCASYPTIKIVELINKLEIDTICYPDKGANAKYSKAYGDLECNVIIGNKVRDQSTGRITDYNVLGDKEQTQDKNILIVDDICDYGNTFIILTKQLYNMGAKSVNLFVTHGLFSNGIHRLKEAGINRIFTNKGEAVRIDDFTIGYKKYE